MARKIICDLCDRECAGGHGTLALLIHHETSDSAEVGMDQFEQKDLCTACADDIRKQFSFTMIQNNGIGPDSMVASW